MKYNAVMEKKSPSLKPRLKLLLLFFCITLLYLPVTRSVKNPICILLDKNSENPICMLFDELQKEIGNDCPAGFCVYGVNNDGTLDCRDCTTGSGNTTEQIQDTAWNVLTGTQTRINVSYDDLLNRVDFIVENMGNTTEDMRLAVNVTEDYQFTSAKTYYVDNATERDLFTKTYNSSYEWFNNATIFSTYNDTYDVKPNNTYNSSYDAQLGHNTTAEIMTAVNESEYWVNETGDTMTGNLTVLGYVNSSNVYTTDPTGWVNSSYVNVTINLFTNIQCWNQDCTINSSYNGSCHVTYSNTAVLEVC